MRVHQQPQRIALLSPGAMGSAVGKRLVQAGHTVLTSLEGRSEASRDRAERAGLDAAADQELANCDLLLSIVPPAEAAALVERFLPLIAARDVKPLVVDANALNPSSKRALAARLATAGVQMVDGAIIGPPPTGGPRPTIIHLAGPAASLATAVLNVEGIIAETMSEDIGSAAALKMCFGGINKGVVGLAACLLAAAHRHGAADALRHEMQRSMPDLFDRFGRQIPDMVPKAYRWIAEMEEIASFLRDDDGAGADLYTGMAGIFDWVEEERRSEGELIAALEASIRP